MRHQRHCFPDLPLFPAQLIEARRMGLFVHCQVVSVFSVNLLLLHRWQPVQIPWHQSSSQSVITLSGLLQVVTVKQAAEVRSWLLQFQSHHKGGERVLDHLSLCYLPLCLNFNLNWGCLVAKWLKHWTADPGVPGSSPTISNRDFFFTQESTQLCPKKSEQVWSSGVST